MFAFADHGSQGLVPKDDFSEPPFLITDFKVDTRVLIYGAGEFDLDVIKKLLY